MFKKVFPFVFFTFFLITFAKPLAAQSSIGSCGGPYGTEIISGIRTNWSYYSGIPVYWSTLEPQRGQFTFNTPPINPSTGQPYLYCGDKQPYKTLKQLVDEVPSGQKVWLQVVTDTGACPRYAQCDGAPWPEPTTIPQWAIAAGVPSLFNPEAQALCGNNPSQWDPKYRELLQEMLTALAREFDSNPKVEAYLMMSGGLWGEMALPYDAYGTCSTSIRNPDNVWVKEMARIYLGSESRATELLVPCNGFDYCFDYYYVESVKKLVDMYAQTFKKPVVLQLGSGASCSTKVPLAVAAYAINTYGSKVWLKQNGWGNPTSDFYYSLFNQYKGRTRTVEEVGWPQLWCPHDPYIPAPTPIPSWECQQRTRQDAINHNTAAVNGALNSGVSAVCFYTEPLRNTTKYPIDWERLNSGLLQNNSGNPTYPPLPSPTRPVSTPTSGCTPSNGDTDGDGAATIFDYEIWRREFLGILTTSTANFDCQGGVTIQDYEVWRRNFR